MSHFGVLSYKSTGHLNPMIALARQLIDRGHRVTFFQRPEVEAQIRQHGPEFAAIGSRNSCVIDDIDSSNLLTVKALRSRVREIVGDIEMFVKEAPAALEHAGVDALIVDEIVMSGPTLAEMLNLPYALISTSVPHSFGWSAPRRFSPRRTLLGHFENRLLHLSALQMRGPIRHGMDKIREQAGLGSVCDIEKTFPAAVHMTQLPECLDLPRSTLPGNFCYAGPFVLPAARRLVEFPWDRLDARPLAYVSLGTTRKSEPAAFRMIAEACASLNLQAAISLGGRRTPETFACLPGDPIVVRDAPQLELIERAEIVITHGGLNTALETLMKGKPMLAIPKSFDQPAVAARLVRSGVAEALPADRLSAKQIRHTLAKVVSDPAYRRAAREIQVKVVAARGLDRAADVIERVLAKRRQLTHA